MITELSLCFIGYAIPAFKAAGVGVELFITKINYTIFNIITKNNFA